MEDVLGVYTRPYDPRRRNTHTPASLYEAFEPADAKRLADRLELHYTPKHGSWLNMAEIELAVLAEQGLDRRLADQATLQREVAAWQSARNGAGRGVDWRFTTEDARIKLKHLYPAVPGRGLPAAMRSYLQARLLKTLWLALLAATASPNALRGCPQRMR